MNNPLITILFFLVPFVIIFSVIMLGSKKVTPEDYAKLKQLPKTPFSRGTFITGLLWLGLGVFNLFLEAKLHHDHHNATFQQVYGAFSLALGGYWVGLSAPKAHTSFKQKNKK